MRNALAGLIVLASLFVLAFGLYRMYLGERGEKVDEPIVFLFGYFDRQRVIKAHPLYEYVRELRSVEAETVEELTVPMRSARRESKGITPPGFELSDRDEAYAEFRNTVLTNEYEVEKNHFLSKEYEILLREEFDLLARLLTEVKEEQSEQRTDLHADHLAVLGRLNLRVFIETVLIDVLNEYLREGLFGEEKEIIEEMRGYYAGTVESTEREREQVEEIQERELNALRSEQLARIRGILEREISLNFIPGLEKFQQVKTLEFNKMFFQERMRELTESGSPFSLDIPSLPELSFPDRGEDGGGTVSDPSRDREILAEVVMGHIQDDIEAIRLELIRDYHLEGLTPVGSRGIDYTEQMLERLEVLNAEQKSGGVDEAGSASAIQGTGGS